MHPAPSVIIFSVCSGMGFGFLAFLGLGFPAVQGLWALGAWGLGYALAVIGLIASTFHLGNPQRALKAFRQWRSSWLSREGWAACITLLWMAPLALGDIFGVSFGWAYGAVGAVLCVLTVFCTAMIYRQLQSVPRWHHPLTVVMFLAYMLTGGAILSGQMALAVMCALALGVAELARYRIGDGLFAAQGLSVAKATGLAHLGQASVFELPHTGENYLMKEMIHIVGRRHSQKLRIISLGLACVCPALCLLIGLWLQLGGLHMGVIVMITLAALCHLIGAFVSRWLFFAQAEHVVGLYYGRT